MGASRMGFDLTNKQGWNNLKSQWRWGIPLELVFQDTFMKFYCKIVGHDEYDSDGDRACKRCAHYIK